MNVSGHSENLEPSNVLSLFGRAEVLNTPDPLQELLREAEVEAFADDEAVDMRVEKRRLLVSEKQFPDQSLFTLEQQLANLNISLGRLKFYLNDLEDILPIKLN